MGPLTPGINEVDRIGAWMALGRARRADPEELPRFHGFEGQGARVRGLVNQSARFATASTIARISIDSSTGLHRYAAAPWLMTRVRALGVS